MAVEDFSLLQRAGKTIYYVIWRLTDGYAWDSSDFTFKDIGSTVAPYLTTLEHVTMGGRGFSNYVHTLNLSNVNDGPPDNFLAMGYSQSGVSPSLTADCPAGYLGLCIENGRSKLALIDIENLLKETGAGGTFVDHNFGSPPAGQLCYIDECGKGIDNADILVYLKNDWQGNRRSNKYVVARSMTNVQGLWTRPVLLDPGEYAIVFTKQAGHGKGFGPDVTCITVNGG